MIDDTYKLIFTSVIEGTDEALSKATIEERFKLSRDKIDRWYGQEHATIKGNLTEDQAWKLQHVLETMGVEVSVVLETRSNLNLKNLSVAPATDPSEPMYQFTNYQPNGFAEFAAKPLSTPKASSVSASRRRPQTHKPERESKSLKLTHMIAAAVLVMAVSYVGKQLFNPHSSIQQPIAATWEE